MLACAGCCCGHPERGGPKTLPGQLKREMRRAFRGAGLDGRARLAFTECLGPCSEANVLLVYVHARPVWLRRVNSLDDFALVVDWLRQAVDDPDAKPGPSLIQRSFCWTGGGIGPRPPIDQG